MTPLGNLFQQLPVLVALQSLGQGTFYVITKGMVDLRIPSALVQMTNEHFCCKWKRITTEWGDRCTTGVFLPFKFQPETILWNGKG